MVQGKEATYNFIIEPLVDVVMGAPLVATLLHSVGFGNVKSMLRDMLLNAAMESSTLPGTVPLLGINNSVDRSLQSRPQSLPC